MTKNYLSMSKVERILFYLQNFFIRHFGNLKDLRKTYKSSSIFNKIKLSLSFLIMGSGLILNKQIFKGIFYLLIQWLFIIYFKDWGIDYLTGKIKLDYLNLQLIALLLIFCFLWFYFKNIALTIKGREDGDRGLSLFIRKIKLFFINYRDNFKIIQNNKKLNLSIKFSWFLMGIPYIIQKQYLKGIILFLIQVGIISYLISIGFRDLIGLYTLSVPGIKSDFSIVYGLLSIIIISIYCYLFITNLKGVMNNALRISQGKNLNNFKQDIILYLNERFYLTLLFVPIIGILFFTILPLLFMILIAFTNYSSGTGGVIPTDTKVLSWVGYDSFQNLLSMGKYLKTFVIVLKWTLIWAVLATITNYFGGIFLALLINKKSVKGKTLWRTVFIISMAVPQFISLLIMKNMFDIYGPVNTFLATTPIGKIDFWNDPIKAKILIILINMWIGIPYSMVYTSGILMSIPEDLYESAVIEGASKFHIFRHITMPYILFMTAPVLITQVVGNINNFNVIYLLTGGEPFGVGLHYAGGTDILITWLYKLTMNNRLYNIGAAIGILMFIISATLSISVFRKTSAYKREGDFS